MKLLVVGRGGQLGRSIAERATSHPWLRFEVLGRPDLDLAERGSGAAAVLRSKPDVIINAAAYTAVDRAEEEPDRAKRLNADAAGELARAAKASSARFIQVSTDYVFDGRSTAPYQPADRPNPINVYGRSKLAGEGQVRAATPDHLVVRTAWLYSPFGPNFVTRMLAIAEAQPEVKIVADQIGSPTSALDLADGLLAICRAWRAGGSAGLGNVFHFAGTGAVSWAEFAREIFRTASMSGLPNAAVVPIRSDQHPARAVRPGFSALDSSAFETTFGLAMPRWQASLRTVMMRLPRTI